MAKIEGLGALPGSRLVNPVGSEAWCREITETSLELARRAKQCSEGIAALAALEVARRIILASLQPHAAEHAAARAREVAHAIDIKFEGLEGLT